MANGRWHGTCAAWPRSTWVRRPRAAIAGGDRRQKMGNEPVLRLARGLTEHLKPAELDATLEQVTEAAVRLLPNVQFGSITVLAEDGLRTVAPPTSGWSGSTRRSSVSRRPCFQAATQDEQVVCSDLGRTAASPLRPGGRGRRHPVADRGAALRRATLAGRTQPVLPPGRGLRRRLHAERAVRPPGRTGDRLRARDHQSPGGGADPHGDRRGGRPGDGALRSERRAGVRVPQAPVLAHVKLGPSPRSSSTRRTKEGA